LREDLKKVLCEDARYRSDDSFHNYRHIRVFKDDAKSLDADNDEPFNGIIGGSSAREPIKKRYDWNWNRKEFGEHLSVLEGIVRKNEGRPWDKVYSEICKVAGDRSSATGSHIFQHLFDYIETKTYVEDDEIFYVVSGRWSSGKQEHISHSTCEFYVHPKSGCITRNKHLVSRKVTQAERYKERLAEIAKTHRRLDKLTDLRKVDGTWFEFKFRDLVKDEPVWNIVPEATRIDQVENFRPYDHYYGGTLRRLISKRTLSHKELKAHGLI